MADLDRLERDLGFVRQTVAGGGPRSPAAIYFLWAVLVLAGFALVDVNPERVGLYWTIAGPAGSLISAYLGWRGQRHSGEMDLALGLRHMQHWGAMMAVIFLAALMIGRGLIARDAFSPLVLLILAMSYFHAGLYLDPPLRWVGLLLVGGYLMVLSVDAYAWTMVGVLVFAALMVFGVRESRRRAVATA